MDIIDVLSTYLPAIPTVQIEPYTGAGPYGPVYGLPVAVEAVVEQKRRLVRESAESEVLSSTTLYCRYDTECPDGSRITLPDGQITTAITISLHRDHGNEQLPAHVQIFCK